MESRGWVCGEGETRGVGRWACRRVCLCMPRAVRFSLWISKEVFVYVYTVFTVYIDIVLFSVFYSLCTVLPLLTVSSSEFHQLYTRAVHDHLTRGTALLSLQNIHLSIKIHRSMHLYECSPYQKKKKYCPESGATCAHYAELCRSNFTEWLFPPSEGIVPIPTSIYVYLKTSIFFFWAFPFLCTNSSLMYHRIYSSLFLSPPYLHI